MSSGMMASGAMANDIYVDQVGDNTTVSITQFGAGNKVEGMLPGEAAEIGGDGNIVTISQIGVSNLLKLTVGNSNIGGPGTGVNVTATADGSSNTQSINCGGIVGGGCMATTITSNIEGNSNQVTQLISGNTLSSVINVKGGSNIVDHTGSGAGAHTGNITIEGSTNSVTLTQSGPLATHATISHTGSNNTVTVNQQGQ